MSERTKYVAGFLFSPDNKRVVLIKKLRPKWQLGLLNGIGGHVEPGETPHDAMIREFSEETGLVILAWNEFSVVYGDGWVVYFFYQHCDNIDFVKTQTDEEIAIYNVSELQQLPTIPNLQWLIPMCFDIYHEHAIILSKTP